MIRCRVSLVACLLFVAVYAQRTESDCGTLAEPENSLIVNGTAATNLTFPWHVGIYWQTWMGTHEYICGGTLISSDLVITAASCFFDELRKEFIDASEFKIAAGKFYRVFDSPDDPYAQKSSVKYISYNWNYKADMALVRVEPFKINALVKPVCVDGDFTGRSEYSLSGKIAKVVGRGVSETKGSSNALKELVVPFAPIDDCLAMVSEDYRKLIFCAYYLNGSSICRGDRGSGLCYEDRGIWYLRGIVSNIPQGTTDLPCDNNQYAAFTYVVPLLKRIYSASDSTSIATKGCTLPNQPENGSFELTCPSKCDDVPGSVVPRGSVLVHQCEKDHILQGNEATICRISGWDSLPTCIKISKQNVKDGCALPEQPIGGKFEIDWCAGSSCNVVSGGRVASGTFLALRCNEGYTLRGNKFTACRGDKWYLPPTCVKTCPPLTSRSVKISYKYPRKGPFGDSIIRPGTKATLVCKEFYENHHLNEPGYRSVTCLESGEWDKPLFNCTAECGKAVDEGPALIFGGTEARQGEFPWHVGIYRKRDDWKQICGGSLVKSDLVISAAHCFYNDIEKEVSNASQFAVAAGKTYRSYSQHERFAQRSFVEEILIPEKYYGVDVQYALDIAFVRTTMSFTYTRLVRPICIDVDSKNNDLLLGDSGKVSGWGIAEDDQPSDVLRKAQLPYIPHKVCIDKVSDDFKNFVSVADKFCAGHTNGTSVCQGDSGGGLSFFFNGLWYLRGIVSAGPHIKVDDNKICVSNSYTVFTDVGSHMDWIKRMLVRVEPERETVSQGTMAEVNCLVSGDPATAVAWTRLGRSLKSHIQVIGNTLRIVKPQVSDRGLYVCHANNSEGSLQPLVDRE